LVFGSDESTVEAERMDDIHRRLGLSGRDSPEEDTHHEKGGEVAEKEKKEFA